MCSVVRPTGPTPTIRLVDARGAFWTATLMTTGTWVSVATGPVDNPAAARATVHKFPTAAAATRGLAELVEKAKANGFVDRATLGPSRDVGIDRAIVFASHGDAWMDGWAFDSRVVGDDGELAIRRVHDFSADASEMEAEWPPHDALATTRPHRFVDWLHERIDELERSVPNRP